MAEKFVDVRLSEEEAELIDFALDLVTDAYADAAMVERLKDKYRGEAGSTLVNRLRRRCYIPHRAALSQALHGGSARQVLPLPGIVLKA